MKEVYLLVFSNYTNTREAYTFANILGIDFVDSYMSILKERMWFDREEEEDNEFLCKTHFVTGSADDALFYAIDLDNINHKMLGKSFYYLISHLEREMKNNEYTLYFASLINDNKLNDMMIEKSEPHKLIRLELQSGKNQLMDYVKEKMDDVVNTLSISDILTSVRKSERTNQDFCHTSDYDDVEDYSNEEAYDELSIFTI